MISLLATLSVAAASLSPFSISYGGPHEIQNVVERTADGGFSFSGPCKVATEGTPKWLPSAIDKQSLRVSLRVNAVTWEQCHTRIFALGSSQRSRLLMIGQDGSDLVLGVRRNLSDGSPEIRLEGVFEHPNIRDIVIEIRRDLVNVTVDGVTRLEEPQLVSPFSSWLSEGCSLALGREVNGRNEWLGTLHSLEVFVGTELVMDLDSKSDLIVPETMRYVHPRMGELFAVAPLLRTVNTLAHVMAFVVLGALWWQSRKFRLGSRSSLLRIGLIGAGFGLLLQVLKIFVAGRHPSLLYAVPNGIGALFGAWLAGAITRIQR